MTAVLEQLDLLALAAEEQARADWIAYLKHLSVLDRPALAAMYEADRVTCLDVDGRLVLPASDRCSAGRHKGCQHLDTARQAAGGPIVCFCACHYSTDDLRLMLQEHRRNDLLGAAA